MAAETENEIAGALSPAEQRRGMLHAKISTCYGQLASVLINDSSVIILFATLLGAKDMVAVATTSFAYLAHFFLMVPFGHLASFIGKKKVIVISISVCLLALLLCAAAPWFKPLDKAVLLGGLVVFSISMSAYVSAWFPLLDGVVPAAERGRFFGQLRSLWQTVAALFLLGSGWLVGKSASLPMLQLIIALAAVSLLGRIWHVSRIPEAPAEPSSSLRTALAEVITNRPLTGFSIYLFCLYTAASATVPVVFVFAKNQLNLPDNLIILASAFLLGGNILGFLAGGWFVHRYGVKTLFLFTHGSFGVLNFLLLTVTDNSMFSVVVMIAILTAYGFLISSASIAVSSEMLALAPARNKNVALAFCFSMFAGGKGFSRFLASLILGSGILARRWNCFGYDLTQYHSLFIMYGCMVILACILLVLVPAITREIRRLPSV